MPSFATQTDSYRLPREVDIASLKAEGFIHPDSTRTRRLEEFRIIKRSILQIVANRRQQGEVNPNVVMVTSTRPGEGKTFAAINLALSIAFNVDAVRVIQVVQVNPALAEAAAQRATAVDAARLPAPR